MLIHNSSMQRHWALFQVQGSSSLHAVYDGSSWGLWIYPSCSPLPSLDVAVKELISEENRHPHHHLSFLDVVLATPHPSASSSDQPHHICKYCKIPGHGIFPRPKAAVVSSAPVDDLVVTVSQLETMFHRYMSQPSSALLVTSSNKSWLLNFACYNHMTPHASHFS